MKMRKLLALSAVLLCILASQSHAGAFGCSAGASRCVTFYTTHEFENEKYNNPFYQYGRCLSEIKSCNDKW